MKKKLMVFLLGAMMMVQLVPQTVGAKELNPGKLAAEVQVQEAYGKVELPQYNAGKIARVTGVKCTSSTVGSINLAWKQVPGVSGYEILRASSRNGVYKNVMNVAAGNGAFCNRSVTPGTEYYYKVRAYVRNGSKITVGKASKMVTAHTQVNGKRSGKTRVNANLRKSAGINGTYLVTLKAGTSVSIIANTQDKTGTKWYKLTAKANNKKVTGYMRADLIR